MGHLSIAILRKILEDNSNKENTKYMYLVIKKDSKLLKFFDDKTWSNRFDYSKLKNKIIKDFGFPTINPKGDKIDFDEVERFKSNKKDTAATAYTYLLSKYQIEHIERKLKLKEGIWENVIWLSERELSKKEESWESTQKFIFEREDTFKDPEFSNNLRTNLRNIVKAKESGNLVIFAGAGVSYDSDVPGWTQLINELRLDLDKKFDEDEANYYLNVGQTYYDSRGKKEYIERVQEILKHGKTQFNPVHEKIIELQPYHIITTNYDTHFEQVITERDYNYSIIRKDSDLPYSKGNSLYIKMHGDFDEKNLVLKKKDYEKYPSDFPLIEGFIKGIFASKLVLFVGFSFTDPNLDQILKFVNQILKDDNQAPYLLTIPERVNGKIKQDYKKWKKGLEKKGVEVVEYEEKPCNEYFEQLDNEEDKERLEKLSSMGEKVYKFLKIIQDFDTFSDSLDRLDINRQLIDSLSRFKGLGYIPPSVIEKITPFRGKGVSKFDSSLDARYDKYTLHLRTPNEKLLSFLNEKIDQSRSIDFKAYQDKSLSTEEQKLNATFKLLYSSGIYCIIRKSDTSPEHHRLNPINSKEECSCCRCLYNRFQVGKLLINLNAISAKSICRNTQQNIGLIESYGFQKIGQFIKAFYTLEETKVSSWKRQEYITFFIAIYNQTLLLPFISYMNNSTFDEIEIENVRNKIKNINLDKILFDLPIDDMIKETLIIIKENKLFQSNHSIIQEKLKEFVDIYEKYQSSPKGAFQFEGPDYCKNIEMVFYQLSNFYHENLLFDTERSYFINLAHTYIESMLMGCSISEDYKQRVNSFSKFFYTIFIKYGNPDSIKVLLNKYQIECLQFENQEETTSDIIEQFYSFCTSRHVEGFSSLKNDLYTLAIANSRSFENALLRTFGNFMILFQKLNLTEEQINKVIAKIVGYLNGSSLFDASRSLQHYEDLVVRHVKKINDGNIKLIVTHLASDNNCRRDIIKPICDAIIYQKQMKCFLGNNIYKSIIRKTEERKKWSVGFEYIIPFYPLLIEELQESFVKDIEQFIKDTDDIDIVTDAYRYGVWNPDKNRHFMDSFIEYLLDVCDKFPDVKIDETGFPRGLRSFVTWNNLRFIVRVIYKHNLFDEKFVDSLHERLNSEIFKWILKPYEFDYSEFEANWIILFKQENIIDYIKEIPELKQAIEFQLNEKYNPEIAKIYFEKFVDSPILEMTA